MAKKGASITEIIDEIIKRYDKNRSALIQVLLDVQKEMRWLPAESLKYISEQLEAPLPQVYQVATFYKAFSLMPRGRHNVSVCKGTACHVRGANMVLDRMSQKLGIHPEHTTKDDRFTLLTVSCMGCCALGPVISIDDTYYSNPSSSEINKILDQYD